MVQPDSDEVKILQPTLIWRDGSLIPFAEATTHVLSHMSARGSQIFDVLLVLGGSPGLRAFGLREHATRFIRSAETMGMAELPDVDVLERAVAETVVANLDAGGIGPDAAGPLVIKLIASWDEPAPGVVPRSRRPNLYVTATSWASTPSEAALHGSLPKPKEVKTVPMPKIPASVLPPSMKVAAGYTPGLRHHLMAVDEGFDEVLFRTQSGDLAESVTSSVFVVNDRRIAVPPVDSVLDGITRRAVLDVADSLSVPYTVHPVAWDDVTEADELFLSSTMKSIWPIGRLDDRILDAPGPITTELTSGMSQLLAGGHPLSRRWLTPLAPLLNL